MHHIIVGNGPINGTELTSTIDSLWEAAENRDDNYWVEWIITAHTDPQAVTGLAEWAAESGLALVLVSNDEDYVDSYIGDSDNVVGRVSKDPYASVFDALDEERQVLALIPNDVDLLEQDDMDFIVRAVKHNLTVFDIAHQMVEVRLEPDEPSEPAPVVDPVEEAQAAQEPVAEAEATELDDAHQLLVPSEDSDISDLLILTAEDFASQTLDELKAQCDHLKLEPVGDKRTKDAYIIPLLEYHNGETSSVPQEAAPQVIDTPEVAEVAEVQGVVAGADTLGSMEYETLHSTEPHVEVAVLSIYDTSGVVRQYAVDINKAYELLERG